MVRLPTEVPMVQAHHERNQPFTVRHESFGYAQESLVEGLNKHWLQPDWPAPANIHAATTLRTGGVSQDDYASLNPATHVGDSPELVSQNRHIIKTLLDLPSEPVWLNQIHSNLAVKATRTETLPQADASYTNQPNVVCVVMTADCLPLLVCAADGSEIAAIHAGWRGLLDGVIDNTIAALQSRDVLVWLGPAIGPDSFEVGDEVRAAYVAKSAEYASAFKQKNQGKWLADIYQLARINLAALGISKIYGGDFCTVTDQERFYSYRRDKDTGRMATLIWRD
ncbi:peptidoglycan editing factor PgeF [Methyloglobulus sp.]|uniref:peptidoglycan editing factor PgeF n=1 Tax=Methyloglobulus sp. TaxID=2518622 RepID=UPI0032B84F4D